MKKTLTLALIIFLTTACTSFDMAPKHEDSLLKQFIAPQEKAGVYIFRSQLKGHILLMDIAIDNQHLGRTQWETYLYKELTPGKHTVTSRASNVDSLK